MNVLGIGRKFNPDAVQKARFDAIIDRLDRLEAAVKKLAEIVITRLDEWADALSVVVAVQQQILDGEARRRIDARNQADDRSLYLAPATYNALWRRFEPLDFDEAFVEVDNRTAR